MNRLDGLSGFAREFGFSRQRAWQIAKMQAGKCITCGKQASDGKRRCVHHLREDNARRLKRYYGAKGQ